ncbi:DUF1127 domain-containing protein [Abyssibius alkaniclasticus]|uniref:DUF1127 domain-containing protein n=1 Tax=Abyssibius alkaniclasticus TaxID=2881234 RepID=UPI0023634E72|nr:DUF1127 domain-containing protein [Abyssibius alkaniclasticus]UPH71741.1 DUF1127 domain-containing protein [Abyssibius alkaniclasticus]|tara:strand:- start:618 stop:842 length:225 start_codon:yes stop_codon:yes gene_type:complete
MATTQTYRGLEAVLHTGRAYFHKKRDQLTGAIARRKTFLAVQHELSSLTNRDLKDLGFRRSDIKSIAMEAANGS